MRLVLSFIVSSFFFFSPLAGKAGEIRDRQVKTSLDQGAIPELPSYSISDDFAGTAIHSNHNHRAGTQNRFYPVNNFIAPTAFQNAVNFYEEKLFAQPHLYCKRIGLKLVFPEHYFW